MNKSTAPLKIIFAILAIAFAAASAVQAGDRKDYKSYASEINDTKWSSDCDDVKLIAEKERHVGWKMHVKNFLPSISDMFLDNCESAQDGVITCVSISTNYDGGTKNCLISRLQYGRANSTQKAGVRFENVALTNIPTTRSHGILGLGKRVENTCDDAYSEASENEHKQGGKALPSTGEVRACTGL